MRSRPTCATRLKPFLLAVLVTLPGLLFGAVFSGNARVEIADPSGGLGWTNAANALTVSCWFKLAVPSDKTLTENMTILVNRRTGNEASLFAYLLRYNISNGNVEFLSRGSSGLFTDTLISAPYLERWYHVAVVRQGEAVKGYTDGREVFNKASAIGNAANSDGVSVGGWGTLGSGTYLYGEVQEVAIYQAASAPEFISQYMLADQPVSLPSLKGYYKLGYSENAADLFRNFSSAPPTNTTPAVAAGSGQVAFEEANQAGEQSAFDSRKNGGADALAPLSGSFSWSQVLMARPVPGIAFDLRMAYSSANAYNGYALGGFDPFASSTLGKGWRHSFEARVLPSQSFSPVAGIDTVGLMSWDGAIETWDKDSASGRYLPRHKEYRGDLRIPDDTVCEWVTPERLVYRFRHPFSGNNALMRGRLMEIADSNSNTVSLAWNEVVGIVTQVTDTVGGKYRFNYNAQYQITNITFQGWSANFVYDSQNRLVTNSLTAPVAYAAVNTARAFTYDAAGLLGRITDQRGNAAVTVAYDKYGRMTNQVDALSRATRTEYGVPAKRQITRTDSENHGWLETYDRKGRVTENRDPLGNASRNTYDAYGNVRTVTDPRGSVTAYDYDDRANILTNVNALAQKRVWTYHAYYNKPLAETDPLGWTTRYAYDAAGNMTNQWDGIGSLVQYAYDGKGLVTEAKDANGNPTRFGYDAYGFHTRTIDPAGFTNSVVKNELGWTLAAVNALGQTTTFAYDVHGHAILTTDPLFRTLASVYDANGNLTSQSDAKGQLTLSYYDAANQRTQTVDRAGSAWLTAYTLRGEVLRVTDPQTNTVVNAYDAANRLVRVTDPLGGSISNVYDAACNLTDSYDKLGQRWHKTYDRLNRAVTEKDPLGDTRRVTFDAAGRLDTVTSPNGFVSTHRYDGRGRLIRWVDSESYVWLYDYDGVGSITNITDALSGHYVMEYGSRNERVLERNQDGFEWQYAYDALLRPERQTDPNGLVRSVVYDDGGRVDYVGFSTGRTDDYQYDDNNNLTLLSRSRPGQPPTPTTLAYDLMDRPTQVTDAFGKSVRYAYDSLSRVDTLTYPGSRSLKYRYDALSRLTNQTDWASRRLDYAYDKANRLTERRYPNSVVQTNAFDSAGRLSSLQYQVSSNNPLIALTYAYDRNGNKTAATEQGTLDWPQPTRIDETARYTAAGRLIDRTDAVGTNAPWAYHYDASGNMTNAVGAGQSFTLAYDEDNRVLSVQWECGLTSKRIDNRYDALGRRLSRKVDGIETRYILDIQGGMERILCDTTAAGQVTATYVHGADLSYKIDPGDAYICYHADAQANIIALTDSGGTNIAQYAYTPYGRSLGSSVGSGQSAVGSENSYRFVGSQGVMEELPGLYFMRARYYSAEAGMFLSTDPVKKIGAGCRPSAYAYVEGNPLGLVDPTGNYFEEVSVGGSAGVAAGFAAYGSLSLVSLSAQYESPYDRLLGKGYSHGSIFDAEIGVAGLYAGAGYGGDAGFYGGTASDWQDYTRFSLSLGPIDGSIARSSTGKWGITLGAGPGVSVGLMVSKPVDLLSTSENSPSSNGSTTTQVPSSIPAAAAEAQQVAAVNPPAASTPAPPTSASVSAGGGGGGGGSSVSRPVYKDESKDSRGNYYVQKAGTKDYSTSSIRTMVSQMKVKQAATPAKSKSSSTASKKK